MQPRLTIQTRGPLVVRDIDLLRRFERLRVNLTIGTDSDQVRRRYEPRCASIARRLEAAATLRDAGRRIGVSISPMLPIEDVEQFGARLAALEAEEYVAQYFHPPRPGYRCAASSTAIAASSPVVTFGLLLMVSLRVLRGRAKRYTPSR